ncbi:DUF3619 family protein [uncultured Aquabacterium sp.]|uniref:DUF3619 family protein n=1 Tax=uncultured Aquabacterium sp. TaxID=158753 RepID=UPI00261D8F32|nr:DUF3619 family protein [uncultured Aquabacterium sp.]
MKTRPTPPLTAAQREALEARFALRLSARLEEGARCVPHDVTERLRVAREQAVRTAREARVRTASSSAHIATPVVHLGLAGAGATGAAGGFSAPVAAWHEGAARQPGHGRRLDEGRLSWGLKLASVLPVMALVAGLWGVHHYHQIEKTEAAADVDTALLSDDLPPDAYADPGFAEFLQNDTAPAMAVETVSTPDIEVSVQPPVELEAAVEEEGGEVAPAVTP